MSTPEQTPAPPRYLVISKWIWLVGTVVSLISALLVVTLTPGGPVAGVMLGVTIVQAALAFPAALMLQRRKRWARMVLLILAAISLGSLYQAFQMQNWAALVLNLVLGSTLGLLQDQSVREYFGLPARSGRTRSR